MNSILFFNRVYPPADGATGRLLAELAAELVRDGWRVSVVTSRTTTSDASSQTLSGVRVERVGALGFSRASHWRRALSYLSLYPTMLWRALQLPRHDVVVTMTDPPLQLWLGPFLRWRKGSKVVHWAQDLYPELAEEMGVLRKNGLIADLLRRFSTLALRRSTEIVAVGHCMKKRLIQRGVESEKINVIPNWGHPSNSEQTSRDADLFRREHRLDDRFVVMYSGNLGLAHPFEAILDAAERLRISLPEVAFLFVGGGVRLPWVQKEVEQRHLDNVRFLPFQPEEKLAGSLAAADLHLASMRENLCGLVVPSKVFGVLAGGRPCVFLGPEESEAAQLILQHGCGSVLPKATGARLAASLTEWVRHPELLREARQRAETVGEQLSVGNAVARFEKVFIRVSRIDPLLGAAPTVPSPAAPLPSEGREWPKVG